MILDEQEANINTYQNPLFVQKYTEEHINNPAIKHFCEEFALSLPGEKVIDIGCGPGQYTRVFAENGLEAVGVDYSSEMIKRAFSLSINFDSIKYQQCDMRELKSMFKENSVSGAWICASLLHIPFNEVEGVLKGVHSLVENEGFVFIGYAGTLEDKEQFSTYKEDEISGNPLRGFYTLDVEKFIFQLPLLGFKLNEIKESKIYNVQNVTTWIHLILKVVK